MSEKRYTEAQIRDVFARAAEAQTRAPDEPEDGLTLAEMQEIGRASGLDPHLIAAAATGLSTATRTVTPTRLGLPTQILRTRTTPGPVSDDVWEETIGALRSQFGGTGTVEQFGRVREWTSPVRYGWSGALTTHVTVRPLPDGRASVRIEEHGTSTNVWGVIGSVGVMALVAAVPLLVWATGSTDGVAGPLALAVATLAAAVTLGVGGGLWTARSSRVLGDRYDAILDRIDALTSSEPPARLGATEALPDLGDDARLGALDLDALGDAPAQARTQSRTRTR